MSANVTTSLDHLRTPRLAGSTLERAGGHAARYGLVAVLLWIGAMKFTAYEAEAIQGFASHNPLMNWLTQLLGVRGFSALVGSAELLTGLLIAARPLSPRASALGSALAVGTFLGTLSFLFTTPGVVEPSLGFPGLSAAPGQFLLKDLVLLGVSLWSLGESWRALEKSA